jgi:hypothetical protein
MSKSPTKSLVKWEKSDGKKMLKKALWDVNSCFNSMNIKDIHSSDARFSVYLLKNYATNYKNLKKNVNGLRVQVDFNNQSITPQEVLSLLIPHETKIPSLEQLSRKTTS